MDEGVTKVSEMKRHIKTFSRKELKMTDEENRRFFPSDKDIRNIMEYNKGQTRFSNNDKENLKENIDNLKASNEKDSFHLDISGGRRFYEKCRATAFGVCQGDLREKVSCTICGQNYHRHCIEINDEPAYCGCHIQMPFSQSFYQSDKDVHRVLKKIDIQN